MVDKARLKELIREVPDFPKPGISYKDITPLLKDHWGLKEALAAVLGPYEGQAIDLVAGIESRGFILAVPLAVRLGCGFVPVRKPGKLPAAILRQEYALEYGTDAVEIHRDAVQEGQRVLVVDDVLATGGTLQATCRLLERLGAQIAGLSVLVELAFLGGRQKLKGYPLNAVIEFR
jgi:adenine phosphoribosyltransferase